MVPLWALRQPPAARPSPGRRRGRSSRRKSRILGPRQPESRGSSQPATRLPHRVPAPHRGGGEDALAVDALELPGDARPQAQAPEGAATAPRAAPAAAEVLRPRIPPGVEGYARLPEGHQSSAPARSSPAFMLTSTSGVRGTQLQPAWAGTEEQLARLSSPSRGRRTYAVWFENSRPPAEGQP